MCVAGRSDDHETHIADDRLEESRSCAQIPRHSGGRITGDSLLEIPLLRFRQSESVGYVVRRRLWSRPAVDASQHRFDAEPIAAGNRSASLQLSHNVVESALPSTDQSIAVRHAHLGPQRHERSNGRSHAPLRRPRIVQGAHQLEAERLGDGVGRSCPRSVAVSRLGEQLFRRSQSVGLLRPVAPQLPEQGRHIRRDLFLFVSPHSPIAYCEFNN